MRGAEAEAQLRPYLRLFAALAFLRPGAACRACVELLKARVGLETLCSLAIRFFYLAKVRSLVAQRRTNALDEMGWAPRGVAT